MKNVLRVAAFLALVAVFFASCKAHERCPAYGQMSKPKAHSIIIG